jgi:hypothetical protein
MRSAPKTQTFGSTLKDKVNAELLSFIKKMSGSEPNIIKIHDGGCADLALHATPIGGRK